jgi:hypothetical protein
MGLTEQRRGVSDWYIIHLMTIGSPWLKQRTESGPAREPQVRAKAGFSVLLGTIYAVSGLVLPPIRPRGGQGKREDRLWQLDQSV